MFKIDQIDHVALTVKDLEHSIQWYQEILGLERRYEEHWDIPVFICAGTTCLALFPSETHEPKETPDANTIAMRHLAFRVNRDNYEKAKSELRQRDINFRFSDHGICHSIYFFDPDGHELEITTYELQK